MERMKRRLKIRNLLVRECMSEFLGTFILIMFGCGAMAQMKTSRGLKGQYLSVNIAFAVAVMVAMYLSRGISGAHLNPALSLSCCVLGKLAWSRLLPYSFSQLLGAYAGASVVFLMYYDAIMDYSGGALTVLGPNETASIFATYPSSFLSLGSSFFDQMIGTGMIMLCYLPLVDHHNSPAPQDLVPLLVGVVFMGVSMSMFSNCGGGMNPARDLGPRLFMLSAGWGTEVFTCNNYWFWVPIVAPLVGAILGSWVYLIFIQWHLPDPEQDEPGNDLRLATIMQNGVELAQRF
ncbi:aquaporin-10-like [Lampris incognitus]|uniref:aquaporin-10-like n=1 Tax=Lampris incognitus TaxID=2546036 RepID=UPI0024B58B62|nr:aquaporin-10-like [Lampris incognitus]